MKDFYENINLKNDLELADSESLSTDETNNSINNLDIRHLFGKEKLENIQMKLSKATGLAFITVDYRGEPITEATFFTNYCQCIRNNPDVSICCKSSDAFGSIQAAVTQKPSVYYCPSGLLEVAIPIVCRGHYLGGFVGGQVRCNDAPATTSRLESVIHSEKSEEFMNEYKPLLEEIPFYSYEKFLDIANLVFLVINQLSENEFSQHMQEDVLKKRIKKINATNLRYLKENRRNKMRIMELIASNNLYMMIDTLTSLINLTIIEDAPKTNEVLSQFSDYLKYTNMEKETFVPIARELEQAERYLKLQEKKLGDRFEYSIQIPKEMSMLKMPSGVLVSFLQSAVYYGVMLKKEAGKVTVTGYQKNGNLYLEVIDNGPGFTDEELTIKFEKYDNKHEGYYINLGIAYAREKMKQLFGEEFDIILDTYKGKGKRCVIFWPEYFDERGD